MAHKKQGYRFDDDWPLDELKEAEKGWKKAITVPVEVKIEAEHRVLDLEKVKSYLGKANKIVHLDCFCKTKRGNCDAPTNVCIYLNERAEALLGNENYAWLNPKEATLDEAIERLAKSHEAGLVHMAYAYHDDEINSICSCCSCCCRIFSGVLRYGLAPHLLYSDKVSYDDSKLCNHCGDCVDRCQFGAREMKNGYLLLNSELCFGCGLCTSTCPINAISLTDKH